jgi:uncharacterized membrane protein YkvA (DUF1232 family)
MWWQILLGLAVGLVILWLVMLGVMWSAQRRHPDRARLRDALRLIPDVVRLLRRLAADPALPRGIRVRLWLLMLYLIIPIDLIPDFIPVLGYADDAIIVAIAIRSIARTAGTDALRQHWPGTPEGLSVLFTLAGLPPP